MDAWRSPRWVLNNHPEDQFLNLLRRLWSPDRLPDLGNQLPVKRNPPLCQRTTVSGVTAMRDCCDPDQNRRTATQKSLPDSRVRGSDARARGEQAFRFAANLERRRTCRCWDIRKPV